MAERARRLLVAGVTTRALATSAAKAGWAVTAIDAFGDLDLRAHAAVLVPSREDSGFDPSTVAGLARGITVDAVAYTSNFENRPAAVSALAAGRSLLGNPAPVVQRVRNPFELTRALRRESLHAPATRATAPQSGAGPARWMLKPRRSGGGHGTSAWRRGQPVSRRHYLQERIDGRAGSAVLLADGRRCILLAVSRQLVGLTAFGSRGYRYCGSLMGHGLFPRESELLDRARTVAESVVRQFGLVGLNGIDFIARGGVLWPIEVNPRYSASMELLERAAGVPLFHWHAEACAGRLPALRPRAPRGIVGKAVVFARRDSTLGGTGQWLRDRALADIPRSGEHIRRGRPICTVFASGRDAESCLRALTAKAATIYRAVETSTRGAA